MTRNSSVFFWIIWRKKQNNKLLIFQNRCLDISLLSGVRNTGFKISKNCYMQKRYITKMIFGYLNRVPFPSPVEIMTNFLLTCDTLFICVVENTSKFDRKSFNAINLHWQWSSNILSIFCFSPYHVLGAQSVLSNIGHLVINLRHTWSSQRYLASDNWS